MPATNSKRDCWQRFVTLVSEAINSQALVLRERERWSARTGCIGGEESATTMTSPSHLFLPPPPRPAFPPIPQVNFVISSVSSPQIHVYLHRVQPPTFKPSLIPPRSFSPSSELPDLPQAVLVPWSITKSYGKKLRDRIY